MGPRRLPAGGRIDRAAPLAFSFNRRVLQGYRGDTVASALLANGVDVVARSFKYRRPRGIVGSGAAEPSALVQLGAGARALPSRLATQTELGEGLRVSSVAGWPSVERDLLSVAGLAARFLPAGFYYKTFMWPRGRWETYEGLIRRLAGFGTAPHGPDPDRYDKVNAHCDVLVVGGGPAGLAAALAASRQGARVVLADEQPELGGRLLDEPAEIDARPALAWVADATAELSRRPDVRLLTRATAFGAYADNFVAIRERPPAHRPDDAGGQLGQRLWHIAAREIVLATGALERPLVFPNNDRPGVMLASAVSTYVNRYAVAPGAHALVFTNNDHAYRAALDLSAAGTHVVVVDVRPNPDGPLPGQARELGITILDGQVVVDVKGRGRVAGADVMRVDSSAAGVAGSRRRIACDLVAVSGGWTPTLHLHAQTGGDLGWDPSIAAFTPVRAAGQPVSVGACNGAFALQACLSQGFDAGRAAAHAAGFDGAPHEPLPVAHDTPERPLLPLWIAPAPRSITRGPKQFVDLQEDVTAADLALAVRRASSRSSTSSATPRSAWDRTRASWLTSTPSASSPVCWDGRSLTSASPSTDPRTRPSGSVCWPAGMSARCSIRCASLRCMPGMSPPAHGSRTPASGVAPTTTRNPASAWRRRLRASAARFDPASESSTTPPSARSRSWDPTRPTSSIASTPTLGTVCASAAAATASCSTRTAWCSTTA